MLKRKHVVLGLLAFCLTIALFVGATITGTSPSVTASENWDPLCDFNANGMVDGLDYGRFGASWASTGTPINITDLILRTCAGNISVPAASFVPYLNDQNSRNTGGSLINYEDTSTLIFFAGVQLPDGATVTSFTSYWFDDNASNIMCYLTRRTTIGYADMATAHSSGDPGYGSAYDDTIFYPIVDNGQFGYTVEVWLPASEGHLDYGFNLAVIEWEYSTLP